MDQEIQNSGDKTIEQLVEQLCSEQGVERKKARKLLVAYGKKSIGPISKLLNHPKHIDRWEAIKTMEEIGDPKSICFFIQALNDDKSDVRWIAAKGLIKIGFRVVKPLLELVTKDTDSVFVLDSAHHIIYDLRENGELPENFPANELLDMLKRPQSDGRLKVLLYRIINDLK